MSEQLCGHRPPLGLVTLPGKQLIEQSDRIDDTLLTIAFWEVGQGDGLDEPVDPDGVASVAREQPCLIQDPCYLNTPQVVRCRGRQWFG
jgi:hypothetical protein